MTEAGKSVLVVEDDLGTRELLARSLRACGYDCHLACDGDEAMELLSTIGIDLALLDIVMPSTTGLSLFKYMKDNHPEVAVIFVTAVDDLQLVAEYFKQGAYDYIVKSTVKQRLTSSVQEALERRQAKLQDKRHLGHLEELVEHQRTSLQDKVYPNGAFEHHWDRPCPVGHSNAVDHRPKPFQIYEGQSP